MPDYDGEGEAQRKLVVTFRTDEDRERFVAQHKLRIDKRERKTWMTRWPFTEREDVSGKVKFQVPK